MYNDTGKQSLASSANDGVLQILWPLHLPILASCTFCHLILFVKKIKIFIKNTCIYIFFTC